MSKGVRRSFTKEFKMEAVKLATEPGANIIEVARNLGIH
ncbi:MAG: transposase, partial [Nitrospinae bacterium]|nr:transposase [Nitrospinota bacterium]